MKASEKVKKLMEFGPDFNKIQFFHKVKLDDEIYTNGVSNMEEFRPCYIFDELDLSNKTVLDVGCWDGYFSFEAEKKGASRVTSFDDPRCRWGGMDGYFFLHNYFKSRASFVNGNVYNLSKMFNAKEFDVVLCYGVLYHLTDLLFALKNLFHVCKDTIVFEGHFSNSDLLCLEIIPNRFLNNDTGNVYFPSIPYMKLMGTYSGFELEKTSPSMGDRLNLLFRRKSDNVVEYNPTLFLQYESK